MSFLRNIPALVCLVIILFSCNTKSTTISITYPSPQPDSIALSFLPGIVCSDSLDFNSAFSPDGQSYYFARRLKKWALLVSRYDGTKWTAPAPVSFMDTQYAEADITFAPDGSVYYISDRPRNATDTLPDYDIWRRRPLANGGWSGPENVTALNSDSTEYYISFAGNGNLYFASFRAGGYGSGDIYVSKLVNGEYTAPENLGPAINSAGTEHDPCITANEDFLVFTASERKDTIGQADLYGSKRVAGNWCTSFNLGSRVNTPTYEYCSYFSPDGKYLFFSSDYDVKWIKASYILEDINRFCK